MVSLEFFIDLILPALLAYSSTDILTTWKSGSLKPPEPRGLV